MERVYPMTSGYLQTKTLHIGQERNDRNGESVYNHGMAAACAAVGHTPKILIVADSGNNCLTVTLCSQWIHRYFASSS
jgi:hypothetical protein